jgi:sulfatase maturation enzyme AslB (radical SAM superfamily)
MEILLTPEEWTLEHYSDCNDETNLKLSNYIISAETENEILIFHTITWSIYSLTKNEYNDILTNEILIKNHVIVPSNLDEVPIANGIYLKRITKHYIPNYDRISNIVLLTTTACNARCAYCYENNITKKEYMTIETAENVVQFIKNHRYQGDTPFKIQWFGGEPLLNQRVIDYIVDRLYELEIPFNSSMISNAYLINDKVIKKHPKWKLNNLQITLDGLNEEYNNIKNYVYPDIDAYMVVIQNIHNVLNNTKTKITIRFNASNDNIFKLHDTLDYLTDEFKEHYGKKISFYVAPLFQYLKNSNIAIKGYWEELEKISKKYKVTKLNKCDEMLEGISFKQERIDNYCMAFSANGIAIMPNGKFTPCEHVKDEDIFGDVVNGVTNFDVIRKWQFFDGPEINYCKESKCPIHPICPKFYLCDSSVVCEIDEQKNKRLKKAVEKLIRTRIYYDNEINK